mmetsp:Transcript_123580/g.320970  ORF Transcript_123580/g.320970 Transcript_123580/m.320970 type:complete len:220 (-) Transcript_123580:589-1248(-)
MPHRLSCSTTVSPGNIPCCTLRSTTACARGTKKSPHLLDLNRNRTCHRLCPNVHNSTLSWLATTHSPNLRCHYCNHTAHWWLHSRSPNSCSRNTILASPHSTSAPNLQVPRCNPKDRMLSVRARSSKSSSQGSSQAPSWRSLQRNRMEDLWLWCILAACSSNTKPSSQPTTRSLHWRGQRCNRRGRNPCRSSRSNSSSCPRTSQAPNSRSLHRNHTVQK